MAGKGLPAIIQNQRGAPIERVADNIINPVNQVLNYLRNQQIANYVPMGYANGTYAANTWLPLKIDNSNATYYIQDVDTYLLNTQLVVNSGTAATFIQFRLYNLTTGVALWSSGNIVPGSVVLGGVVNYGQVRLPANQICIMQFYQTTGTVAVQCSAAIKVAY